MTLPNRPDIEDLVNALRREIAEVEAKFTEEITALRSQNLALKSQNARLHLTIEDLRRQLKKNSSNSSKPPSSDGVTKPARIAGSLRGKSGKASGGQPGHTGDTLKAVPDPDVIERHEAQICAHCRTGLTAAMVSGVRKRQVFDVPQPRLLVTEHRACIYHCAACSGQTLAPFPDGVTSPVQYGPRIKAAAVYLNVQQLIPEDRTAQTLRDLFGTGRLCPASIVAWGEKKAGELAPLATHIAGLIAAAPVRHLDETGFRIGGKTQWLHCAVTQTLTGYRACEKRGDIAQDFDEGVVVHDHFKPYCTMPNVEHALCNAHHLRELKALIEIDQEAWAKDMRDVLLNASQAVEQTKAHNGEFLPKQVLLPLVERYDKIVGGALAYHDQQPPLPRKIEGGVTPRRPGHNLALRLRGFKDDVLRFLHNFAVPFTNNLAEQALRMMKVKTKISGSFRTMPGAKTFASLRTVIATATKQGWNILNTLTEKPETLILKCRA